VKKNILIVTPIYPAKDGVKGHTPVVHYFAKEWVKLGYNVRVINSQAVYHSLLYNLPTFVYKYIEKIFGVAVKKNTPRTNLCYISEGVIINRICINKILPRFDFSYKSIQKHFIDIESVLNKDDFQPDCILNHWDSPSMLLVPFFRDKFPNSIISVVLHGMPYLMKNKGVNKYSDNLKYLDFLGFRNKADLNSFELHFPNTTIDKFLCYSGVPDEYVKEITEERNNKRFNSKTWNYIYVGMLIDRKYPDIVLDALINVYKDRHFCYSVIGEGALSKKIERTAIKNKVSKNVRLLGRIPRNEVVSCMVNAQCFIMISKNEAFGLVYLEAMLAGCIVIASRNEGIDGIIIDGYNGFLCESGNTNELENVILKIKSLPIDDLENISKNAVETAMKYTDYKVAKLYLENIGVINES